MQFNPKCKNNEESFITATGYYRPCCWRSTEDKEFIQEKYNLNKSTLSEAIEHSQKWLSNEIAKENIEDIDNICKIHCVYNLGVDKNYE